MINNFKFNAVQPPPLVRNLTRMEVWYDRDNALTYQTVPDLDPYTKGKQRITLTQAPCATTIKHGPQTFLRTNQALAHELGFKFKDGKDFEVDTIVVPQDTEEEPYHEVSSQEDIVQLLLEESSEKLIPEILDGSTGFKQVGKDDKHINLEFTDPWKTLAARELISLRKDKPNELTVWYADLHRISDPIPVCRLGPDFATGLKKKKNCRPIPFGKIKNFDCVIYLIKKHTHWGFALWEYCRSSDKRVRSWAETLRKRIISFLGGKPDPLWSREEKEKYYVDPNLLRDYESRALRLIEVLKTLSGIFVQRYLSLPEEVWTWEKFDMFNLQHLSFLISDEFFDGECNECILNIKTFYKSLKDSRKLFKKLSFNETPLNNEILEEIPKWLRIHIPVWKKILGRPFSEHKAFQIGIYCQSRGCGTPPLIDVLLSKRKFVETVTTPAPLLSIERKRVIQGGLRSILRSIPDYAFTGLTNKAIISVTTSACLEKGVREGGTTQAIADELSILGPYHKIPIRDLETGKITEYVEQNTLEIGEKIFWHCLQKIFETDPEILREVALLVVKEPGKARCVTKGSSYLKVILDVINKICSYPLKKGISSSESGMSKESHGWEFFKSLFADEEPSLFNIINIKDTIVSETRTMREETYKDVSVACTDYITATDCEEYEVASIISGSWMLKCGIPRVLRGIVMETCYKPRKITFHATGPLGNLGNPTNIEGVRQIRTTRGILMGDPLTKPCLHLVNVLARVIAMEISDPNFLR